ncbi:MAG: class I SAM-dependent methyltransferase [Sphingobacteriaceae bacterium]|nr:MAG: class I SAM-dependent methyltransferase [Sphingobacteriaceae bacterium]
MKDQQHWDAVYSARTEDEMSWFQQYPKTSLDFIKLFNLPLNANIIDVGGGASTLVDDLLAENYSKISVLDISAAALEVAQNRLGQKSSSVQWIEGDITTVALPENQYDLWHDRAVFHFLTDAKDRQDYVAQLTKALKQGGHLVISTFAEGGPQQCSNLPVVRYSPESLQREFGAAFALQDHAFETHVTPFGTQQEFVYCRLVKCSLASIASIA